MRTCRERGIETVAVFSDVDRLAAHVQHADFAIEIGAAPASESYLVLDKILEACERSGADAVHPGYGFLSENSRLPSALADAGVKFIGPPSSAMELMGSKTAARRAMADAGVPMVPGGAGDDGSGLATAAEALAVA